MMSKQVWKNIEPTIAKALKSYLQHELQHSRGQRSFFRLDGFDKKTYGSLLFLLKVGRQPGQNVYLADTPLEIRTTAPLRGHKDLALESDKSATWYRNNVSDNHALLLIFNQKTSDAQSLKDIHSVTESYLASGEQPHLLDASFEYSLSHDDKKLLKRLLQRYRREVMQPQLRNLVAFFLGCDLYLIQKTGSTVAQAMGHALPYLGLFRSYRLEKALARLTNLDTFLKRNHQAAEIGGRSLEDKDSKKYQTMLDKASFDDDRSTGGLSPQKKYQLLQRFIHEVTHDSSTLYRTLCLDWNDVSAVLYRPKQRSVQQRYQDLATEITQKLKDEAIDSRTLSDDAQDALETLRQGHEIDNAAVDALSLEVADLLPKRVMAKVRKIKTVIKAKEEDFLLALMHLASALAENAEEVDTLRVRWQSSKKQVDKPLRDAIHVFHTLYGGIEKVLPSVDWQLGALWEQVRDKGELESSRKAELVFHLELGDTNNQAELTWVYHPKGQHAATYGHLHSTPKNGTSSNGTSKGIPIYDNVPSHLAHAIDITTPLQSLGVWYREHRDMYHEIAKLFPTKPSWWQAFTEHVDTLAAAWHDFLQHAQSHGIFAADISALVQAYHALLHYSNDHISAEQDINQLYRWLSKMWLIAEEGFSHWAVMPLLHPLKLHWLMQRTQTFEGYIQNIADGTFSTVSTKRFTQELASVYSSTASPSVLTLLSREEVKPSYFSPIVEQGGYELYRTTQQRADFSYGMQNTGDNDGDISQTSDDAAKELAKVIRDYLETYPFSYEGLDIYLLQCRNGTLIGALVLALDKLLEKRENAPHLTLTVHTEHQHVQLYEYLQGWLQEHPDYAHTMPSSFFPRVTLRLLHCPLHEVANTLKQNNAHKHKTSFQRYDMVILADVLAEKGATIASRVRTHSTVAEKHTITATKHVNAQEVQRYRTWPTPYTEDALIRELALSLPDEGQPWLEFYRAQEVAKCLQPQQDYIDFVAETSLRSWESLLLDLHVVFNWVVCYDTVVDRFLLESIAAPHAAEVIRYAVGLGPQRQHNLTVSASQHATNTVKRRLATRLEDIFPNSEHSYREVVATKLLKHAKDISGDLVLRAAGPGAFLNELIGVVASQRCLETTRAHVVAKEAATEDLHVWIYLDDFVHWFESGHKYPDLLEVTLSFRDDRLSLDMVVLETKCLDESSLARERKDAVRQVKQGLNRFADIWSPEHAHADKPYWLNQLYQALAVNLSLNRTELALWDNLKSALQRGDFTLRLQGYVAIFCYSGDAGLEAGDASTMETLTTVAGKRLELHTYNRAGLRNVLQAMLDPEKAQPISTNLETSRETKDAQTRQRLTTQPEKSTQQAKKAVQEKAKTPLQTAATRTVVAQPPKSDVTNKNNNTDKARNARETEKQSPITRITPEISRQTDISQQPDIAEITPSRQGAAVNDTVTTKQMTTKNLDKVTTSTLPKDTVISSNEESSADDSADDVWLKEQALKLEQALKDYNIKLYPIKPELADIGPNVVRYKIELRAGESLSRLQKIADDLVHRLALKSSPLIDNVLGTRYVGIDLPSQSKKIIRLLPFLEALPRPEMGALPIIIGQAPDGKTVIEDLSSFPHLLVAGSTNSGKSVFLRALILSLMQQYSAEELKLLIIDPKRTDFSFFNGVPHLLTDNVITDAEEARDHLLHLVHEEMPRRQNIMQGRSMRIKDFNIRFPDEALPPIVAVIDEYAQLLSIMERKEQKAFEKDLMSLAAVARSTGIHLVLATQRPDAKIVTGALKANLPARIAFRVASAMDSRIVLDQSGAENLLGKGDMLFMEASSHISRLQAPFIDEVTLQNMLRNFA